MKRFIEKGGKLESVSKSWIKDALEFLEFGKDVEFEVEEYSFSKPMGFYSKIKTLQGTIQVENKEEGEILVDELKDTIPNEIKKELPYYKIKFNSILGDEVYFQFYERDLESPYFNLAIEPYEWMNKCDKLFGLKKMMERYGYDFDKIKKSIEKGVDSSYLVCFEWFVKLLDDNFIDEENMIEEILKNGKKTMM